MALSIGTRIGPDEVTGTLGAGGMGEVYRAHDARLARDVALKVLPDAFAADPERLARFQREAQVLASLKRPNIGAIYGLEEGPAAAFAAGAASAPGAAGHYEGPAEAGPDCRSMRRCPSRNRSRKRSRRLTSWASSTAT